MAIHNSHQFFKKLSQKEKQKADLLYAPRNKQNKHNQADHHHRSSKKQRRTKTQISCNVHTPQHLWLLDGSQIDVQNLQKEHKLVQNWARLSSGLAQFSKIVKKGAFFQQIKEIMSKYHMLEDNIIRSSIVVELFVSKRVSTLVDILIEIASYFIVFGKANWSLAAISPKKYYDLLSLNAQGSNLQKTKLQLSKVQLQKQQLMKRVFGFSSQKEKDLQEHQLLAKLQLPSRNVVYFVIKDISFQSDYQLYHFSKQIIQNNQLGQYTEHRCKISFLRPNQQTFNTDQRLVHFLKSSGLTIKKEQQLSRPQRERYLKQIIKILEGQLTGKQQQLNLYRSQNIILDQQLGIPSQRILMNQQRYSHLNRKIKQVKIL